MVVTLRIRLVVLVLAVGGASLDARAGGISDIVSDFLYLQEELTVKAAARAVAEVVTGVGERFLGLVDAEGGVPVWDIVGVAGGRIQVKPWESVHQPGPVACSSASRVRGPAPSMVTAEGRFTRTRST